MNPRGPGGLDRPDRHGGSARFDDAIVRHLLPVGIVVGWLGGHYHCARSLLVAQGVAGGRGGNHFAVRQQQLESAGSPGPPHIPHPPPPPPPPPPPRPPPRPH